MTRQSIEAVSLKTLSKVYAIAINLPVSESFWIAYQIIKTIIK
jgi:hypothetical protein